MTPTITVMDKLFVQMATINVGIKAANSGQLIETIRPVVVNRLEITSALKIQTGI